MTNEEIKLCISRLQSLVDIQSSDGNYNCGPYMHGMANGLILALSVFTRDNPKFLDKPEKWLDKDDDHWNDIAFVN